MWAVVQHHAKWYQPPLVPLYGQRLGHGSGYALYRQAFAVRQKTFRRLTSFLSAESSVIRDLSNSVHYYFQLLRDLKTNFKNKKIQLPPV